MTALINASTSSGVVVTSDTSGSLALQTANTTAVTIDSSQNVGIGTTSPTSKLHVYGSTNSQLTLQNATNSSYVGNISGSMEIQSADIIKFNTAGATERMRIDTSGNLLLGTTTNFDTGVRFSAYCPAVNYIFAGVNTHASSPYGMTIRYSAATPNGVGNEFIDCEDSTAVRFRVRSNGGIANYSGNNTNLSDQREKKDIELAGNYLDKVCAIPVKTFNYIDQPAEDTEKTLGVIAQDVQAVAPELVSESNWANKDEPEKLRLSVYQTDLTFALMKAIQELKAELDATKAEVAALKGTV